jgi:alanyl-tRNA synthetase
MEKMKTLDEIIVSFFDSATAEGFDMKPRGSLLSPYFQNEFNLSAAHQYVVPILSSLKELAPQKIVINEPCFRRIDIEKIGYSPYHLLLFEMGVIGILGYTPKKSEWLREILKFSVEWLRNLGFKTDELIFTISAGARILWKTFKKDNDSYAVLKSLGVSDENILWTKGRRNFIYSVGDNRPAGYGIEIFCYTNDTFVEIGSLNIYSGIYKNGSFHETLNTAIGAGFGFERLSYIINHYDNVFQIEIFSRFMEIVREYFEREIDFTLIKQRLCTIGELLKVLVFVISDGQLPDQSSRGKILKKLAKNFFSEIIYLGLPPEEIVMKGVRSFLEIYSKRYREIKSKEDLIKSIILDLTPKEKGEV